MASRLLQYDNPACCDLPGSLDSIEVDSGREDLPLVAATIEPQLMLAGRKERNLSQCSHQPALKVVHLHRNPPEPRVLERQGPAGIERIGGHDDRLGRARIDDMNPIGSPE